MKSIRHLVAARLADRAHITDRLLGQKVLSNLPRTKGKESLLSQPRINPVHRPQRHSPAQSVIHARRGSRPHLDPVDRVHAEPLRRGGERSEPRRAQAPASARPDAHARPIRTAPGSSSPVSEPQPRDDVAYLSTTSASLSPTGLRPSPF